MSSAASHRQRAPEATAASPASASLMIRGGNASSSSSNKDIRKTGSSRPADLQQRPDPLDRQTSKQRPDLIATSRSVAQLNGGCPSSSPPRLLGSPPRLLAPRIASSLSDIGRPARRHFIRDVVHVKMEFPSPPVPDTSPPRSRPSSPPGAAARLRPAASARQVSGSGSAETRWAGLDPAEPAGSVPAARRST
ncbi:hypothetical protein EYF80_055237 [Liparis tanakae]|uniref:Uncharacterized protein n=1 Tax=Liparis tanakae TaxID=230148 RepID=A0A4Z2F0D7_9TELE|nr:hypothetical protein EYF80_055237 [Liparis tanakae]